MIHYNRYIFSKKQLRYLKIKHLLDILLSVILLLPVTFVVLIFCCLIRLESKGSPFFKQSRTGYHQKIFTIYKLRSMRIETRDKTGRSLTDEERITFFGKIVRKTSIDELPQLINILKGEMSFIGPRPFLINDLDTYNEEQLIRFEVLPGITSWAALHGRNNQSIQEKYNHEIYYVKNVSFLLDLYIFIKTVILVFSQKNVDDHVNEGRIAADIIEDMKEE